MIFYGSANLHCTFNGRFMIAEKDERHPVPGRQANQFLLGFGETKPGGLAHNTITRNGVGIANLSSTVHSSGDNVVDGNGTETAGGGTTGPANKV